MISPTAPTTIDFAIVLYEGFDELDAIAPFEVLQSAARAGVPFRVTLVALEAPSIITAGHGLKIPVEHRLADVRCDWLIVPGGAWVARLPVGAWGEIERGVLPRAIAEVRARGTALASVCTGAMLLSAAGLTRGRRATTHHVAKAALGEEGAHVVDARVVDDGDLVTAGGVTSGLDLGLWLIERLAGEGPRREAETRMEYELRGPVAR